MTDRRVVAVGLLASVGGVLLVAVPSLAAAAAPTVAAVALTVAVGLVAVGLAVRALLAREAPVDLPAPERRPTYRSAGGAFAALLDDVGLAGRRRLDEDEETARERLRGVLETLAVDVLGRREGMTPETARERLADGAWTDDPKAAAFFADGYRPPVSRLAYLPWARPALPFARRGRHVVAALAERVGVAVPDPDERDAGPPTPTDQYWPSAGLSRERATGLTAAVIAGALAVSAVGVGFGQPAVVVTAALGIALVAAARLWPPEPTVALTRSLSTRRPAPGGEVTVTVTVRNTGDRTLPDVRLIDGVPPGLCVVAGSPRLATALRPGKAATAEYTVEAVGGRHTFEPGVVVVGDPVGAAETVTTVSPDGGPTTLDCGFDRGTTEATPRPQVEATPGQHVGAESGAGVEFDTLREYRPGDPPARIDWYHRAKTGDLVTVEFREPRLTRVAVVVDTRPAAYVARAGGVPAPRHGALAALTLAKQLLAEGVPVGFGTVPAGDTWTPPGTGPQQRATLRERLAGDGAVPWLSPTDSPPPADAAGALTDRLAADVQVLFVSPLCDDGSVTIARTLDAAGHSVTVVSPDVTGSGTVAAAYGSLDRWRRLSRLRAADVPVTDWDPANGIEGVGRSVQH
ncbi:DUF58 domain-containing protein [Haloarcula onubensis]|uniref:DUF58 domain-containing protein n=1 Tax=Haloarcula onubensis TaxID=2950539 RepID=A0ABU2FJ94_9EURY|nr:DUF58 domain-containing protein [Halomicroarcula sp. S3CR25-11]MDS0280823.1 DUF58 domain-containing protein [Halomicroarcula sp. S3CR25-11]